MKDTGGNALEVLLVTACKARGVTLATAESCTGGMIAERITSVSGSSSVFLGGVVSYANEVKRDMLGVPQELLDRSGAVSAECAQGMAAGARDRLKASMAVSVTGIAGPDGGTPQKPVGLVYLGLATAEGVRVERCLFVGDRDAVRRQASTKALTLFLEALEVRTV